MFNWKKDLAYLGLEDKKNTILAGAILISLLLLLVNPILCLIPPIIAIGLPMYLAEVKRAKIRKSIPDLAMDISSLWGVLPLRDILKMSENQALREAGLMIERGASVKEALKSAVKKEPEIKPIADILLTCYKTGIDASKLLSSLAEEIASKTSIDEEMKASLTIEKMTLVGASGVIVPFVLGAMSSLTNSFYFPNIAEMGITTVSQETKQMAILGSQIYVILYALIVSFYLALSSGKLKKAVLYSGVLVPLAFLIFSLASTIKF